MRNLFRAIFFLLRLAARLDRTRLVKAAVLMAIGYSATPLIALAVRQFVNASLHWDMSLALWLALAVAILLVFELMMEHFAHLSYFELGELQELALNDEIIKLANGSRGLEHFDNPEFADRLTLVHEDLVKTRTAFTAVLQLGGIGLQTVLTAVILVTLNPWLALLPLAAVPPVILSRRAQRLIDAAQERTAEQTRLSRHLLRLSTTAAAVKEIRLCGAESELISRQAAAWSRVTAEVWRAQRRAALIRAAGQVVFAIAYGVAILLVIAETLSGSANVGDAILLITLAVQVSVQVATALGLLTTLQGTGRTVERLEEMRRITAAQEDGRQDPPGPAAPAPAHPASSAPDRPAPAAPAATSAADPTATARPAASERPAATAPSAPAVRPTPAARVPERLVDGITLENVSFAYPGTGRQVLTDISLHIPAGTSVAVVGENGAGKSTLVKLLCGLYRPTRGRILADSVDLAAVDPAEWRSRVATLFQDFARFELLLRENVGVGELSRMEDEAILAALESARASAILDKVPGGLDGLLGRGYGDGVELSGGQWQSLGLARASMRRHPLLLALDEPASALDATAEHAIFERYAASAATAAQTSGGITVFVSHRFSTVRMADLIVVLADGRITEAGDHDRLMANGGTYAELFRIQARVYR